MITHMQWFNLYGLVFIIIIMIPNTVYAVNCKNGFNDLYKNKIIEAFEQIGRVGCLTTMIFNIPGTCLGFLSDKLLLAYILTDSVLVLIYCLIWIFCFNKNTVFKALSLSIIPSAVFIFSGILSRSLLLTLMSLIFAPCHIMISYKNAVLSQK